MTPDTNSTYRFLHWPSVKPSVWFFAIAVAACAIMLIVADIATTQLNSKLVTAKSNLNSLKQQYTHVITETQLIQQYLSHYQQLTTRNFIGNEDRLSAVEAYKQVKHNRKIPALQYNFQPVTVSNTYNGITANDFSFQQSINDVTFSLNDETDLVAILQQLTTHARGYYTVDDCTLSRKKAELNLGEGGNLRGNCTISWLSLKRTTDTDDTNRDE